MPTIPDITDVFGGFALKTLETGLGVFTYWGRIASETVTLAKAAVDFGAGDYDKAAVGAAGYFLGRGATRAGDGTEEARRLAAGYAIGVTTGAEGFLESVDVYKATKCIDRSPPQPQ
jgi:hypothetical protein